MAKKRIKHKNKRIKRKKEAKRKKELRTKILK